MPAVPDLSAVIRREQAGLAAETRIAQCPPFVAVNNLDDVTRLPSKLRLNHPATIHGLANSKDSAFIVDCPSIESTALWVHVNNTRYREDYLRFLNGEYGLNLTTIPSAFDVDHLYNLERARIYGLRFVRMALLPYAANRSHGAGPERDVTKNEELREPRDHKLMDELTSMKYFGFLAPLRSEPRQSEVEAYAAFAAAKLGLDPEEVRKSIKYLREKASTPWARKR